ncbi:hypothetical protein MRB53_006741 [Persea americana]|uniref:Uncharacterized protein n=1 Tax=Persea americana TaxID=3435 RepID=A0ACC2MH82_PERAE|nr:hypothetical protein MRB53_006741 [Persea americana]
MSPKEIPPVPEPEQDFDAATHHLASWLSRRFQRPISIAVDEALVGDARSPGSPSDGGNIDHSEDQGDEDFLLKDDGCLILTKDYFQILKDSSYIPVLPHQSALEKRGGNPTSSNTSSNTNPYPNCTCPVPGPCKKKNQNNQIFLEKDTKDE